MYVHLIDDFGTVLVLFLLKRDHVVRVDMVEIATGFVLKNISLNTDHTLFRLLKE